MSYLSRVQPVEDMVSRDDGIYIWKETDFSISHDKSTANKVIINFHKEIPDNVKAALEKGIIDGSKRRLVISHESFSGICTCLRVQNPNRNCVLQCNVLVSTDREWQLVRPTLDGKGTPQNNLCIHPVSPGDPVEPCVWILPPLILHSKMNIFGVDSVDTVNQTFKAELLCELRLRGISKVCGVCACVYVYVEERNLRRVYVCVTVTVAGES
jgi:hypothetical protein